MKLAGHIALVTGGSGGIGEAICRSFCGEGATVWIADRDVAAASALADSLGSSARAVALDVADEGDWQALAAAIDGAHGRLDVLVNAAGISGFGAIDAIDFAFWSRFQRINADSIFLSVHSLRTLLERSPAAAIVNIGSTLALRPHAQLPAYSAAKGSLRALTRSLALYFADRGCNVRCNAVHPGSTLTPMMEANLGADPERREELYRQRVAAHPLGKALGRVVLPEDVAKAVLFLASDDSAFITGIDLPVDGGATCGC